MRLARRSSSAIFLAATLCCSHVVATTTAPATDLTTFALQGKKLDAAVIDHLEDAARADPSDAATRAKLLGYYSLRPGDEPARRLRQVLWMIQNRPADAFVASDYCRIDPTDAEAYGQTKAIWTRLVSDHPDDTDILRNAAAFFAPMDDATSERLLQHAAELRPKEPEWPERLAVFYERRASSSRDGRVKAAELALAQRLRACYLTTEAAPRFHTFVEAPRDAVRAGDYIQAKKLAQQLILTAGAFRDDPQYGWAMHVANIVFGRVAVHTGDVDTGNSFLIAAGQVPPSPLLASRGPDMSLAKELLRFNQRRMVRDYLNECEKIWPGGTSRLRAWAAKVDTDGQAVFGTQALD